MARESRSTVLREIDQVFNHGSVAGMAEGQLLRRFADRGDESAFEALVAEHGPMVLGVCRRLLHDASDVEDAFQATFLVLVRKAGAVRDADALGPWLHGVAYRVAARVRANSARRRTRERQAARSEAVEPTRVLDQEHLRQVLDEEVNRLPEKYRRPVVLCYLEGRTHAEAAHRLRWTAGMVRGRLDRARARLRSRLARRGLAPTAAPVVLALAAETSSAAVAPALMAATIAAARRVASGRVVAATAISAPIITLVDGVLRTMFLSKLKFAASLLAAGAFLLAALPYALALDDKAARPTEERPRDSIAGKAPKGDATVTGRVLDLEGRPIEGARVARGSDLRGSHDPEATTDAQGRFAFDGIKPGELILTVQARGHAPDLKRLVVGQERGPVEFRLGPGRTIRGRIVDVQGKAIAGAPVAADSWRGHHSLRWRAETDAEGRFRWDDAPGDEVVIDLGQLGFPSKRYWRATPSDDEETIPMRRPLRLRGSVSDAETGKPVETFTLVPGYDWGGGQPVAWQRDQARTLTGGRFDVTLSTESALRVVRIEAEGYLPADSRGFKDDEREQVFDVALRRGTGVAGVVRLPDGMPLAGADVVLVTPSPTAFITNGRPPTPRDHQIVQSGPDGRFSFPHQEPPYTVVVLHDRGFAERNAEQIAASRDVTVRPWGRVEGTLRIGDRPGAGQALHLAYRREGDYAKAIPYYSGETTADDSGHFTFERVIPGEVTVSRAIKIRPLATSYSHTVVTEVEPGSTAHVTVGGTGRPVIGRVVVPAGLAGRVNWAYSFNGLRRKRHRPAPPDGLDAEAKPRWAEAWDRSDEGKAYRRAERHYAVKVEPDGSFRVEDVEAGTYDLWIIAHEPPANPDQGLAGNPLGSARREVIVPEVPGGRSDEPLDVGATALEPIPPLK